MKNKNILVSVILLAEGSNNQVLDKTLKDIFNQTWRNLEVIVTHSKQKNFNELKEKWFSFPANIHWCECDDVAEILSKPRTICNGDYIFYKSANPIIWYPRHIEYHLEILEESKVKTKWSYSLLDIKDLGVQEPINCLGWRLDFPRQDQFLLDEFCHSNDIIPNWKSCIVNQNNVTQFIPGLIIKDIKKYQFINPKEITITLYIQNQQNQQAQQQVVLGAPANNDIKETLQEINGELVILKSYPTIVGNVQFSDRNKEILKQINPNEVLNIAVKRSMGMGDVLLTEPVIRALKKKYNKAKIKLFTTNYSSADKLVTMFPELDAFEIIGQDKLTVDYLASVEGFNLKFDLDLSYESRPGFRYIDGYLEVCGFEETLQEVNGELEITRGLSDEELIPKLNYDKERFIKEKYFTAEFAGSGWQSKEWDTDKWKIIAKKALEKGYKMVYLSNQKVILGLDAPLAIINQVNDFDALINYLKYADFHIGVDNGPMQLSSAFNKPEFIVAGAALQKYTNPSKKIFSVTKEDLQCLGCKHRMFYEQNQNGITFVPSCTNKEKYSCMKDLSVDYVSNKFDEFLKVNNL